MSEINVFNQIPVYTEEMANYTGQEKCLSAILKINICKFMRDYFSFLCQQYKD